jgi:hypothetical protein
MWRRIGKTLEACADIPASPILGGGGCSIITDVRKEFSGQFSKSLKRSALSPTRIADWSRVGIQLLINAPDDDDDDDDVYDVVMILRHSFVRQSVRCFPRQRLNRSHTRLRCCCCCY